MKILFITTEYYIPGYSTGGGLGVYIRKTAALLAKRGHDVTVVTFSYQDAEWSENNIDIKEVKLIRNPRGSKRFLSSLSHILFLWNRWRLRLKIISLYSSKKFDVIQVSSYLSPGLFLPRKWPLISRISSIDPLLRQSSGYPAKGLDHLYAWYEKKQLQRSRFVFAPSKFLAKNVSQYYGLSSEVIPTINQQLIGQQDFSFYDSYLKNKRYLLYFGQMSRIKGTDILADALKKIFDTIPYIYMVCIGRDDGLPNGMSCHQYIISRITKEQQKRLLVFGPLPISKLIPCIQHSLCVLQPSRVDNLPNSCIETLSLQIPVIGSTSSSIEELVKDGVNGFLFPNGNAQALAECTINFLKGKKKLSALGLLYNDSQNYICTLENLYLKCCG